MGVYGEYRRRGGTYYYNWIFRENRNLLTMYLDDCWDRLEHDSIIQEFEIDPFLGYQVLTDFKNNADDPVTNWQSVLDVISEPGCEVIIISGSKRSGKTYDGWRLLEALHNMGFEVYWVGPPVPLPEWCNYAPDVSSLPRGAVGLVDETAVFLNSRKSMSKENIDVLDHIPTMAHAGVKTIFITQSTARTDVALTGWADMHIKKKYKNVYQQKTERDIVQDRLDFYFEPPTKSWSFARSHDFTGMYWGYPLDWYDDTVSKPFSLFENKNEGLKWAYALADAGFDGKYIQLNMKLRGWKEPVAYWDNFAKKAQKAGIEINDKEIDSILASAGL